MKSKNQNPSQDEQPKSNMNQNELAPSPQNSSVQEVKTSNLNSLNSQEEDETVKNGVPDRNSGNDDDFGSLTEDENANTDFLADREGNENAGGEWDII